ncbi:hypothetical protein CEXT_326591 [Caerostris extrusa]|uniref:Uncharacterized protein n=1 Tax=Caerostris extrusa TaxID=172846 RepID=A0AAV4WNI3_CAEEX|nr:hypothetical protein CEXT_326591 [Caerostris extrusa]
MGNPGQYTQQPLFNEGSCPIAIKWAGFVLIFRFPHTTHQPAGILTGHINTVNQRSPSTPSVSVVEWMLLFSLFHCSRYVATFLFHVRKPVAAGPLIKTHP